jgi:hypothetical protein
VIVPVTVTVETGEPIGAFDWSSFHGRWASLQFNGITVFRDLVYDTEADKTTRSDEQAARNLLLTFQARVNRVLEGDP